MELSQALILAKRVKITFSKVTLQAQGNSYYWAPVNSISIDVQDEWPQFQNTYRNLEEALNVVTPSFEKVWMVK